MKLAVIAVLLPLLLNLFFASLTDLIIISFDDFSSLTLAFMSVYQIQHIIRYLKLYILKKLFRVVNCLMISVLLIMSALIAFIVGFANLINLFQLADFLNSGVDNTRALIIDKKIDVINNHTFRIKPNFDGHETNYDLKSSEIFSLKPFYATKLLKL